MNLERDLYGAQSFLVQNREPQNESDIPFNIKRAVTDSNPLPRQQVSNFLIREILPNNISKWSS
jgi:hypothetical protein